MQLREKLKKARKLISKLNNGGFNLVVEGKRDAAGLRNIGVTCDIFQAAGKPQQVIEKVVQNIGSKPVILFDFDETGKENARRFTELLISRGVSPDASIRREFRTIFGLRFFEEVDNKLDEIMENIEKNKR